MFSGMPWPPMKMFCAAPLTKPSSKEDAVSRSVKEAAAVAIFAFTMWFFVLFYVASLFYAIFVADSFVPLVLHLGYYLCTKAADVENTGGRPSAFLRRVAFWKYFREYFPIAVTLKNPQTTKFFKDRKYLFGYHPHGVTSLGAMGIFGPIHEDVSGLFGGLEISGCTLDSNFRIPVVREFLLAMGAIAVNERAIKRTLLDQGRAVMVVLGGASEALYAKPLKHDVVVRRRFGFFRIALETGSAVVPVYSFGENELYDQIQNGLARRINELLVKYLGFFVPVYFGNGRTLFNPVPKRTAIKTVVGEPIPVEITPDPSADQIQNLKDKYIAGLVDIFDRFADVYSPKRVANLTIVE